MNSLNTKSQPELKNTKYAMNYPNNCQDLPRSNFKPQSPILLNKEKSGYEIPKFSQSKTQKNTFNFPHYSPSYKKRALK